MKPIYLRMKAFGSYKEEEIDFSKVQQGVFLITGDTGAGKTTIFDAITYALYGESSGGKRDSRMMVSQFAEDGEYTEVEFAFSYGKDVYKIRRSPEQPKYKEKKDEEGNTVFEQLKTTRKPEVELTLPNGEIFIGKLNETNKKIQEIIGIDASQFTRVVMLAQGDFLKLLHARSDERKEIFSKIFDTGFYDAMEKEMERAYKECEGQLKDNEKEIESSLASMVCTKDSKKREEWENRGKFSIDKKEEIFLWIEEIIREYAQLAQENSQKKEEFDRKKEKLQKAVHEAQTTNQLFEELKAKKEKYGELEQEKEEIDSLKKQIEQGEKALKIAGSYSVYADKREGYKRKEETVKALQSRLSGQKELLGPLEESKKEADKSYEEEFPKKIEEASKLEEKLGLYEEIEALQKLYDTECTELKNKEKEKQKKVKQETEEKEKAEKLEKELEQLSLLAGKSDYFHAKAERLEREKEDFQEYEKLVKNQEKIQKQLEKQEEANRQAQTALESAEKQYNTLYQNFLSNQAHILRAALVEGEPCPVCGSTHHISIPEEDINVVGQEEVEQAKEDYETARSYGEQEKEKLHKLLIRKEENDKLLEERKGKLNWQEITIETIEIEDIGKHIKDLSKDLEESKKKEAEAKEAEKIFADKQEEKRKNQENLEKTGKEKTKLEMEIAGLESSIKNKGENLTERKSQLPYPTKEETTKRLEHIKNQQNALVQKKKEAEERFHQVSDEVKRLESALETENKGKDILREEEEAARLAFQSGLSKQGFSSEQEFLEAKTADDKLEDWKKKVADYEKILQETRTGIALLSEKTKDKTPIDVKKFEMELTELQKEIGLLETKDKEVYAGKQTNEKARDRIQKKWLELEDNMEQYQVLKTLHDTANGKLSKKRIDFQTYIQRYYFKQVIYAANERLKTMSNNQFILQCRKLENLGTQGNVGLDIDVYSLVNDQIRDVKTLSGGESFMAALSMALGLSDMIQSKAGKIKMDTMFIDEGFGSLSEDTRNQALGLLHELSEGNRLIGIISHVSELKAQVDTRLHVTKNSQGSKAEWSV